MKLNMENRIPEILLKMLQKQYDQKEIEKIVQGYQAKRKVTLRVNSLKSSIKEMEEELFQNHIEYEKVDWNKEAIILKERAERKVQELACYKEGKIYLQSLSSMLPPILLEPKENENILDMTAAPGSKTTQIAAISNNKAFITACEINKIRAERLKYNIEKQGAKSVYVMLTDARKLDNMFSFDKILLDAPCSGSGTFSFMEENKKQKFDQKLIEKITKTQLDLLEKAIQLLKPGKEMIYSTCSILSCENEEIIQKVLAKGKIEIVPISLERIEGIPLLPVKINGTICVCPNELYEGFFVAKIKKK